MATASLDAKTLRLTGDGMGGPLRDYVLLLDGAQQALCAPPRSKDCVGVTARFVSPYEFELQGPFDAAWEGEHELGLRRGDTLADGTIKLRFVPHDKNWIRSTSVWVSLAVLVLILLVGLSKVGLCWWLASSLLLAVLREERIAATLRRKRAP